MKMKKKTNQKASNNNLYYIDVQYADDNQHTAPDIAAFQKWAEAALKPHITEAELAIRIVSPEEMTELNTNFRNKHGTTNVLSFPAPPDIKAKTNMLGDIVICSAVVNKEAEEQHKEQNAHWAHMTIHGIFHLLGYDHEDEEEAVIMESQEKKVLHSLGFPDPYSTGENVINHE